jgi:DNA-binding response OmpR family regulator
MTMITALVPGDPQGSSDDSLVPRILLVEDDAAVAASLRIVFGRSGMVTDWAGTGAAAMALVKSFDPHIVLVDLELPDTSGIEVIRWLTANHACGIIVLTGNPEAAERIVGLELGADDYISKPPVTRELVARVRAVLRRVIGHRTVHPMGPATAREAPRTTIVIGAVTVDLALRQAVNAEGVTIDLTAAEFAVLEVLANPVGETVFRDRLSEIVLRRPWRPEDRSVDQLIFMLRSKMSPEGEGHRFIQTVRGAGYRLVLPACR